VVLTKLKYHYATQLHQLALYLFLQELNMYLLLASVAVVVVVGKEVMTTAEVVAEQVVLLAIGLKQLQLMP
jgi:hypothetical protein